MEALIGAFLDSGGVDNARLFMAWAGIPHCSTQKAMRMQGAACSPDALPAVQGAVDTIGEDRVCDLFMDPKVPLSPIEDARSERNLNVFFFNLLNTGEKHAIKGLRLACNV